MIIKRQEQSHKKLQFLHILNYGRLYSSQKTYSQKIDLFLLFFWVFSKTPLCTSCVPDERGVTALIDALSSTKRFVSDHPKVNFLKIHLQSNSGTLISLWQRNLEILFSTIIGFVTPISIFYPFYWCCSSCSPDIFGNENDVATSSLYFSIYTNFWFFWYAKLGCHLCFCICANNEVIKLFLFCKNTRNISQEICKSRIMVLNESRNGSFYLCYYLAANNVAIFLTLHMPPQFAVKRWAKPRVQISTSAQRVIYEIATI